MPTPRSAVEDLSSTFLGRYGIVEVHEERSGQETVIVVESTSPREAVSALPMAHQGYPVRLRRAAGPVVPRRAPPDLLPEARPVREAEPLQVEIMPYQRRNLPAAPARGGMPATADLDAAIWNAIEEGSDPLLGLSFEDAVAQAPVRVEALVHQRIHQAFHEILRAPQGMRGTEAGFYQRETYLLRNSALRTTNGRITAEGLADSLERNWEDYSCILQWTTLQAAQGNPMAAAYVNHLGQHMDTLQRAFREAAEVARRAERVSEQHGQGRDAGGWARVATVILTMGQFVFDQLQLPVGRAPAGRLPGAPPRPLAGGRRREIP